MKNDLSAVNCLPERQDIVDITVFPGKEGKGERPWLFVSGPSLYGDSSPGRLGRTILLAYSDLCRQQGVAHLGLSQGGREAPFALPGLPESSLIRQDTPKRDVHSVLSVGTAPCCLRGAHLTVPRSRSWAGYSPEPPGWAPRKSDLGSSGGSTAGPRNQPC